jgi:acyl-CoA thioester hydrolase
MSERSSRPKPVRRSEFRYFVPITTRWMYNDLYGHHNNVVYYSYFDMALNMFLIEHGGLDIHASSAIGLVAHTECDYFAPLAYPGKVEAGLQLLKAGNSSVQYEIGLFGEGQDLAAACERYVLVYVDRGIRRSQPLPEVLRRGIAQLET